MRPRDDGMIEWWWDYLKVEILLDFHISWYSRRYLWCDRRTDELKDWWTNVLSYRDAMMHLVSLVNLLWHLFARKYWFPLFFTKAWPTDGPSDGPTYRDARTYLKIAKAQARTKEKQTARTHARRTRTVAHPYTRTRTDSSIIRAQSRVYTLIHEE